MSGIFIIFLCICWVWPKTYITGAKLFDLLFVAMETAIFWSCVNAAEIDRKNSRPCQIVLLFSCPYIILYKSFLGVIETTKLERQNNKRIKPLSSTDASYEGPKYGEIWQNAKYVKIAKLHIFSYYYEHFCNGSQEIHSCVYTEQHLNYWT